MEDVKLNVGEYTIADMKIEVITPISKDDLIYIAGRTKYGCYVPDGDQIFDLLGQGAFGDVLGYKEFAIKINCRDGDYGEEPDDAEVLKSLQGTSQIPILYAIINKNIVVMQRVKGETVTHYKRKMKLKNSPNYINPAFNIVFEDALKDIMRRGWKPHDLHGGNVMIESETGMPVIVDVGLFRKTKEFLNIDEIDLRKVSVSKFALECISDGLEKYIEEKSKSEAQKILGMHMNGFKELFAFGNKGETQMEMR